MSYSLHRTTSSAESKKSNKKRCGDEDTERQNQERARAHFNMWEYVQYISWSLPAHALNEFSTRVDLYDGLYAYKQFVGFSGWIFIINNHIEAYSIGEHTRCDQVHTFDT